MRFLARLVAVLIVLVVPTTALAQDRDGTTLPETDISLTVTEPGTTPLVGETFSIGIAVANQGPAPAEGVSLDAYLPEGLGTVSATPGAATDTCTVSEDSVDGPYEDGASAPSSYPRGAGSMRCDLGTIDVGDTATVSLQAERTAAREIYVGISIGMNNPDPNYDNNYADVILGPDTTHAADVGVSMSVDRTANPGERFTYRLRVTNSGPNEATGVVLVDPIPYGVNFVSASSSDPSEICSYVGDPAPPPPGDGTTSPEYYGYQEVRCELGTMPPNSSSVVSLVVERSTPWSVYNSAWVSSNAYDTNYENDYAYHELGADPSVTSDLVTRTSGPADAPVVGDTFQLRTTVRNDGPSGAGEVWISFYVSDNATVESVNGPECSWNTNTYDEPMPAASGPAGSEPAPEKSVYPDYYGGAWINCRASSLGTGDTTSVTATLRRTGAREMWVTSTAYSANHDPNYDDNYAELKVGPDTSNPVDVSITKTASKNAAVGEAFDYVLQVANAGPSTAENVVARDLLPEGVEFASVSSSSASDVCRYEDHGYAEPAPMDAPSRPYYGGRSIVCDIGTLGAGDSRTITVGVTRTWVYELWNSASVATTSYDANYDNDYAYLLTEGEPWEGQCVAPTEPVQGTDGSDSIVIGGCTAKSGPGADTIEVAPASSSGDSRVAAGAGPDSIFVNVGAGADQARSIVVYAGKGADHVSVSVAPGASNTTVLVYTGDGADSVTVDAPPDLSGVRIKVFGGSGRDSLGALNPLGSASGLWSRLVLIGGAHDDDIQGGPGPDRLDGRRGGDAITGGAGNDALEGGRGPDACDGGWGRDSTRGC